MEDLNTNGTNEPNNTKEEDLRPLPDGWAYMTLASLAVEEKNAIVDGPFGSNLKLSDYIDDDVNGVPVLTTKNLKGDYSKGSVRYISQRKFQELKRSEVRGGDILVAKIGSCGKTGVYPIGMPSAIIPANLLKFTVHPEVNKMFVYYFLNSEIFQKELAEIITATAQPAFNVTKFRKLLAPVPQRSEQDRIIMRLEEMLSDLEAGVAALERVRAGVKRYKASVLKAAVEGKLVEQNRGDEPAKKLLQQLGKILLEDNGLSPLPEGWCWATWDQVGKSQNGRGFPSKEYQAEGVKLLRPGNLFASGDVIWTEENTRYLPKKWEREFPQFVVGENELIINLTAQSLKDEFLGRVCITGPNENCLLNQRLARLTPLIGEKRFFLWLFKSKIFRRFVDGLNKGSLIQHMFTSQLAEFSFPFPPLEEQRRIVAEVERRLEAVWAVESAVEMGLKRAGRLRQAVLRSAFEGRL